MYELRCDLSTDTYEFKVCRCVWSHPEHLVEVVILLSRGVQQEGLQEQPGVRCQPQHLNKHNIYSAVKNSQHQDNVNQ